MDRHEPDWFRQALANPSSRHRTSVAGVEIAYTRWEPAGTDAAGPDIVLVHGGGGNAHWWDHVAPLLAERSTVIALDLSGHGDSGWRARYSLADWVQEIQAAADHCGLGPRPVVIGHSMGGLVALALAIAYGADLTGIITVDAPLSDGVPPGQLKRGPRDQVRTYPSKAEAVARFRPIPPQPDALDFVVKHIAEDSVRETAQGWVWKFDLGVFAEPYPAPPFQAPLACRAAVLQAEHGLASIAPGERVRRGLRATAPVVVLPAAGHHVMVDSPLSLVAAVRTVLAGWRHSCVVPSSSAITVPPQAG